MAPATFTAPDFPPPESRPTTQPATILKAMSFPPTSLEQDILNTITDEAVSTPILTKLTELRQGYANARDTAVTALQAKWDKATAIQIEAGNENQRTVDALTEQLATVTAERNALDTLRATMTERVSSVLQSGDPAQYEALAAEFLTPAYTKRRAELLAAKQQIDLELAALPAP